MNQQQFYQITHWQRETFPSATSLSKLKHLAQEIIELEAEIQDGKSTENIKAEFADCFILLYGAASSIGLTFNEIEIAVDEKMKINKARKWGTPDQNGVVNHIKTDNHETN